MKKLFALFLCVILAMCTLVACQNSEENNSDEKRKRK